MKPFALLLSFLVVSATGAETFDVLVYGGTPSGVAAATNAAPQGVSVALVEETYQIGGMTAGGLAHTDFKTFQSLGRSWKEFMDRVQEHFRMTYGEGGFLHDLKDDGSAPGFFEGPPIRISS